MAEVWRDIVAHYERCFVEHGVSPRGVDWPNARDLEARFECQLSVLDGVDAGRTPRLLDLGCGPGLLLDYLEACGRLADVEYQGIDLSEPMIEAARSRWPQYDFSVRDVLTDALEPECMDVVVMNGVLTEKLTLSQSEMVAFAQKMIMAAYSAARVGIAFNIMSSHVDWERDDLFHWPFDELATFLRQEVSRHYAFRADYGLYEYTALVWREPRRPAPLAQEAWWQRNPPGSE